MSILISPIVIFLALVVLVYSLYKIFIDKPVTMKAVYKGVMIVSKYDGDTVVHRALLKSNTPEQFSDAGDDIVGNDLNMVIKLLDERLDSFEQIGIVKGNRIFRGENYDFSFHEGVAVIVSNKNNDNSG